LSVIATGVSDFFGDVGTASGSSSTSWATGTDVPVVVSVGAGHPSLRNTPVDSVDVVLSEPINSASFNYQALSLTRDGGSNLITSGVTVTEITPTTFSIGGLGFLTTLNGNYDLTVNAGGLVDGSGNAGVGLLSETWAMSTVGPTVTSLPTYIQSPRNIIVPTIDVIFSEPIVGSTFTYQNITYSKPGGPNLITPNITITQLSPTEFAISNFNNLLLPIDGTYTFTISAGGVEDLYGNTGTGSASDSWTLITTAPAAPTGLAISPNTGATPGMTDTGSVTLSGTLPAAGLSVDVMDGNTDLGYANVDGTSFSIALTLPTGANDLTATAIDAAGNVSPAATLNVLVDENPLTISSVTGPASTATKSAVGSVDVTFSAPVNLNTFTTANLILTDNGGPNLITSVVTIALVSGTTSTYEITGLSSLTNSDGTYVLTVNAAGIEDEAGNVANGSMSTTWLMDTTPPASSVTTLPSHTTSTSFVVSVAGTDPAGSNGSTPAGIAAFGIYVSKDGGAFSLFTTVTAADPSAVFLGQAGHSYGFFSVATDSAGNVQATPSAAQQTVQILAPMTVSSIAAVSPDPRNATVSDIDVTFSVPLGLTSTDYDALTLTDNGGRNLITSAVTFTHVSGSTYDIGGLTGLTLSEGNYSFAVSAAFIDDQYGNPGTGSLSTTWLMDTTPPTSSVNSLPATTTSTNFTVSVTGTDPAGSNGSTPSGIASFAIYVSKNGGAFTLLAAVTPADPSTLFNGQAGNTYGFYSVATDYAGNVQATPASAQQTVQILSALSVSSFTPVSPNPRNTSVSSVDVTFSEPINTSSLVAGALTLTDGGGSNLIKGGVSLSLVSGETYAISGLMTLTTTPGEYTLTVNSADIKDQNGAAGTNSLSTQWLMDTAAPSSHVVNSLGTSQASDTFPVSVTFSDPAGPGSAPASGVSTVQLWVSVNNGAFSLSQSMNITPADSGTVTFTFTGQDRNVYAFHSIAIDAAGNTESKSSNSIEASTSVPDLNPPVTHVLASSPLYSWGPFSPSEFSSFTPSSYANGVFTLNWAGADPDQNSGTPAGSIAKVDVYVEIDGSTTPTLAGQLNGGTPNGSGVYSGSLTYDALADNQLHTYKFFSVGIDDEQKAQAMPGTPDVTFSETYAASLAVSNVVVEKGIAERSFIQYLDVDFNQTTSSSSALLSLQSGIGGASKSSYLELLWYGENPTNSTVPTAANLSSPGVTVSLTGGDLSINFGKNGVTSLLPGSSGANSATSSFGDGWFVLGIDTTGGTGPVFWETFFRLLGDTDGSGTVTGPYTTAGTDAYNVYHAEGQSGLLLDSDVNGDGAVNSKDLQETVLANGHAVGAKPTSFPQFQLFAGAAVAVPVNAVAVTQAEVQALVPAAIDAWRSAGLDAAGVRTLESAQVQVGNLGPNILGLETADVITINQTAGGFDWYVSAGGASSQAFGLARPDGESLAASGSTAANQVDLVTVLEHEVGHVLGLADNAETGDLMDVTLGLGERREPTSADVAGIVSTSSIAVTAPVAAALASTGQGVASASAATSKQQLAAMAQMLPVTHAMVDAALTALTTTVSTDDQNHPVSNDVSAELVGRYSRRAAKPKMKGRATPAVYNHPRGALFSAVNQGDRRLGQTPDRAAEDAAKQQDL
jgi:hypothetical protein